MLYTFQRRKKNLLTSLLLVSIFFHSQVSAQSTSWKGTTSVAWATASNWTNGIPSATLDVIIGDASFTGSFQPSITATATAKSLTIGMGTTNSILTSTKLLTVSNDVTIGVNGTITHNSTTTITGITVKGNWFNYGNYTTINTNARVTFAGTIQSITGFTNFRQLSINSGSVVTLNSDIAVGYALNLTGTLDPNEPSYFVDLTGATIFSLASASVLRVKALTFDGNYSMNPTTINAAGIIEYASTEIDQTISNSIAYGILKINTTMTAIPEGDLLPITGNINVAAGIFDILNYSVTRSAAGGTITIANGATLRIGDTNSFPANFTTKTLGALSTVEYYGTNQTVIAATYGNLNLSSVSGDAIKTMPVTSFTIAGNLTTDIGTGTSLSFSAGAIINITGNFNIGASVTFNSLSFAHTLAGNFINNGTYTTTTGKLTMSGVSKSLSGSGITSFYNLTFSGAGITASSSFSFTVAGAFATSGTGTFTHTSGGAGTLTISGTGKTITGTGVTFGNLTITGTITTAVALIIAGDFTVNTSFITTAAIALSGASNTISGTGATLTLTTLNITGGITCTRNITLSSNLSVTGTFIATAGTITFNGTSTITQSSPSVFYNIIINSTKTVTGPASSMEINGNFQNNGTFTNNSGTVVFGGTTTLSGTTTNNFYNLTNNGILNFPATTVNIKGDLINNSIINTGTGTIVFNGTTNQHLTSVGSAFYNVTISNVTGVTLNDDLSVSNVLSLSTGKITTGSYRVICTSTASGAVINFTSSSYIYGNLRRYIANNVFTYSFPVGTASAYTLEELINHNLAGITYIDASFGAKPGTDAGMHVFENGTYYTSVNSFGVWYLTPNASPSSGTYDLKCYTNGFSGLADNSFSILSRPDASTDAVDWGKAGGTLNANGGLGRKVSDGYALRKNLTSFSQKGIGQSGSTLPVTLSCFNVSLDNNNAILNWTTSAEIATDKFEIEVAGDNFSFEKAGEIKAAGTSVSELKYEFADYNIQHNGMRYYRLKIIDLDQTFSYSPIRKIAVENNSSDIISIYPNPSNGIFQLQTNFNYTKVSVYDLMGFKIFSTNEKITHINLLDNQKGLYLLELSNTKEKRNFTLNVN